MSESDLQVNLSCELRTENKPTICTNCIYSVCIQCSIRPPLHYCLKHRVSFVTDQITQFALCEFINVKGTCHDYESRPAPKCVVIENVANVTLWQKIKKLFN